MPTALPSPARARAGWGDSCGRAVAHAALYRRRRGDRQPDVTRLAQESRPFGFRTWHEALEDCRRLEGSSRGLTDGSKVGFGPAVFESREHPFFVWPVLGRRPA